MRPKPLHGICPTLFRAIGILTFSVCASAQSQDTGTKLDQLRQDYQARRQLAVDTLNEAYVAALDRLQSQLTKEGDVDGALKVLERKTELVAKFSALAGESKPISDSLDSGSRPVTKMAEEGNPESGGDEDDQGKSLFDPVGTVWMWSAPGVEFTFEDGGVGLAKFPQLGTVDANHIWERAGPRKFKVTRPDIPDFHVLFEILSDGDTAVYSNLGGSIFKRMVSRIHNEQ